MINVDKSIIIKRSQADVFSFVTDPNKITKWRSDVAEVTDYSGDKKVGATFHESVKGFGNFTMRIKAYNPPKQEIIETIDGPQVRPTQTYTFTQIKEGTEFKVHISVQVSGFFKLLQPILPLMIKYNWSNYLAKLKQHLENEKL